MNGLSILQLVILLLCLSMAQGILSETVNGGVKTVLSEERGLSQAVCRIRVTDQDGKGIGHVMVNICSDTLCTSAVTDEQGWIVWTGEEEERSLRILKAPNGYAYDPYAEVWMERSGGEAILTLQRIAVPEK